jgi:hypothetical protein
MSIMRDSEPGRVSRIGEKQPAIRSKPKSVYNDVGSLWDGEHDADMG